MIAIALTPGAILVLGMILGGLVMLFFLVVARAVANGRTIPEPDASMIRDAARRAHASDR